VLANEAGLPCRRCGDCDHHPAAAAPPWHPPGGHPLSRGQPRPHRVPGGPQSERSPAPGPVSPRGSSASWHPGGGLAAVGQLCHHPPGQQRKQWPHARELLSLGLLARRDSSGAIRRGWRVLGSADPDVVWPTANLANRRGDWGRGRKAGGGPRGGAGAVLPAVALRGRLPEGLQAPAWRAEPQDERAGQGAGPEPERRGGERHLWLRADAR
jgi:hypothetical protein